MLFLTKVLLILEFLDSSSMAYYSRDALPSPLLLMSHLDEHIVPERSTLFLKAIDSHSTYCSETRHL